MATEREMEAAFIERITAGATHELRNVLAIVKESAGLIEDLMYVSAESGALDRAKVSWALTRIQSQVGRGTALLGALNRFAHSLGGAEEAVDLGRVVEQAVALSERFARRRELRVEIRQDGGSLLLPASTLRMYMALVAGVECCAEQLPAGGTVVVGTERWRSDPAVRFSGKDADGRAVPIRAEAAALEARMRGDGAAAAPVLVGEGAEGFLLVFPVRTS